MRHTQPTIKKLGRTLSVDPRSKQIAWTFFQDSVIQGQRVQNARHGELSDRIRRFTIPYLIHLLDDLSPHALLVPETEAIGARRRSQRVAGALTAVIAEAHRRGIAVHVLNSQAVKKRFTQPNGNPAQNKRDIYRGVIEQYPEMLTMVPKARLKPWESEPYFEPLFNTVAMFIAWREVPSPNEMRRRRVA